MIFETIEIHNLFSYYGRHQLDLRGADDARNVVLITGRNGFGKTSLLNSLKLLFTGVNDALRASVQRQRTVSPKQYVLGAGDDWQGIVNSHARRQGQTTCGVSACWQESAGQVRLSRTWDIAHGRYQDELSLQADFIDEEVDREGIERFIAERIPESYLPFYFFDGEQVQTLAEANRDVQTRHIEQLLNISKTERLQDALKAVISGWRKDAMNAQEEAELKKLYHKKEEQEQYIAACEEKLAGYEEQIADLEWEIEDIQRQKKQFAAYFVSNDRNKTRLKERYRQLESSVEKRKADLTEKITRSIPLLANQGVLNQVKAQLDAHLQTLMHRQYDALQNFFEQLPDEVFHTAPPPPIPALRTDQREFYREQLRHCCAAYLNTDRVKSNGCDFSHIPQEHAKQLQQLILKGMFGTEGMRTLQQDFKQLQKERRELTELRIELDNLVEMSPAERQRFEHLSQQKEYKEEEKKELEYNKRDIHRDMESARRKIDLLEKDIRLQEHRVKLSHTIQKRKDAAEQLKNFFREYKQALKKCKREALETAINKHVQTLMTSHHLIARIHVDDSFGLHYLDAEGQPVAMGGISAGMKQLVATALLWALKDVSDKQLPMVIDTPLARIDMKHQLQLIDQYYPQVAKQVILLPTDSEIDAAKHARIKPYVYREYCLVNPDGRSTSFASGSWWEREDV